MAARETHDGALMSLAGGQQGEETAVAWTFERVAGPFTFTEGPVWVGNAVLFTDIPNNRIMRYDPLTGECEEFWTQTEETNGLTLDRQDRLYGCQGGGRRVVRYEADRTITVLADRYEGKRLNSPNDIVVDARGWVWFTDPRYDDYTGLELDHESVYRLDPQDDGSYTITRVVFDTVRPNGLVLSPDEDVLYVAESPRAPEGNRQLRAYPVQADGSLGPMRVLHDFGPHRGIDGMRVDAQGNIVATCGWKQSGPGPRIAVFSPAGDVLEEHPVAANPTNCCFGGDDLMDLYVTDAEGSFWRARADRRGLARA